MERRRTPLPVHTTQPLEDLRGYFGGESDRKAMESKDKHAFYDLNNRVHRAIVQASNNAPLIRCHEMVTRQLIRIQNLYGIEGEAREDALAEHEKFIVPLLKRDKARALAQFSKHLRTVDKMVHSRLKAAAPAPARAAQGR